MVKIDMKNDIRNVVILTISLDLSKIGGSESWDHPTLLCHLTKIIKN